MCHRWVTAKRQPNLVRRTSYAALLPSQQLLWVKLNWWPRRARLDELSDVSLCVREFLILALILTELQALYASLNTCVSVSTCVCLHSFHNSMNSLPGYSIPAAVWKWVLREKCILTAFPLLSVLEVSCLIMNQFQAFVKILYRSLSPHLLFLLCVS